MTRSEAAAFLMSRDHFCILTHRRPDGDTIGSAVALCRGLRQMGKQAHILENPEITVRYVWLPEGLTKKQPEAGDTLVCVDTAARNMLPDAFAPWRDEIVLRIDHHGTAQSFTPFELVDAGAGACGEIIWDILTQMELTLDEPIATALYVAISTDTGCFRFSNTTAHTFQAAAACAAAGAPVYDLNQALFETVSIARLRMQGWMAEHSKMLQGGSVAVCAIPKTVEEELGVSEDDMDNISSFLRTFEGVKVAALLREADDRIKLSIRAMPGHDAGAVCALFGGGGHKAAAGASIKMPLAEAEKAVTKAILDMAAENGQECL